MPKSLVLFGAAAVAAAAVVWFALRDDAADAPPGRDPDGPGSVVSTTEDNSTTSGASVAPIDAPPEEVVRAYLDKLRGLEWDKTDALGEADAWKFVKDPEAVRALVAIAARAGEWDDRAVAIMVLGWSRLPMARTALENALAGAYGSEFQSTAALSLGNADPTWAVPLLRDAAVRSSDLFLSTTAMLALLMQEAQGALPVFVEALDRSEDDPDRRLALFTIVGGRHPDVSGEEPDIIRLHRAGMPHLFEAPHEIPAEFHGAVSKFLSRAAKESDPRVTHAAARAVLKIPGEESHRTLVALWEKGDEGLRQMVLTLVNPGDPEGPFPALVRHMPATKDREARDTASLLLGDAHDPVLLPGLRAWRKAEADKEIRARLEKAIERLESY